MTAHSFLFTPTTWLGEGEIEWNMIQETLPFYTKWTISAKSEEGIISSLQQIEVKGVADVMRSQFLFSSFTPSSFHVEMENDAIGKIEGKGIFLGNLVGWEFKDPSGAFEGFEFYELQGDGTYRMRAEFVTADQFRTKIEGKIWQKAPLPGEKGTIE